MSQFLSQDCSLTFYSLYSETYNYIVNINLFFVHIQNNESIHIIILQYT